MVRHVLPGGQANVLLRNYPSTTEALVKKLRIREGGEDYLIGTTCKQGKLLFHARRVR
jgi:hypothetical protein